MILFFIIQIIYCVFSYDFIQKPNIIQLEEYTNIICVFNKTSDLYFENINWVIINSTNNFTSERFKNFIINNKVILQIKNITKYDKKYNYKCEYYNNKNEVFYYLYPKLNSIQFVNSISKNNINIIYFTNNININFKKIFPIPKCFIKINNEFIFPENIIQNKTLDYLYSFVNLNMKIKKIYCYDKIKIICFLMERNFNIGSKNNTCLINTFIGSLLTSIILIILFLIFLIIITIIIYLKEKN